MRNTVFEASFREWYLANFCKEMCWRLDVLQKPPPPTCIERKERREPIVILMVAPESRTIDHFQEPIVSTTNLLGVSRKKMSLPPRNLKRLCSTLKKLQDVLKKFEAELSCPAFTHLHFLSHSQCRFTHWHPPFYVAIPASTQVLIRAPNRQGPAELWLPPRLAAGSACWRKLQQLQGPGKENSNEQNLDAWSSILWLFECILNFYLN